MPLTLISEPLKSQGTIVDSPVIASKAQARYEFLRDDFGNLVASTSLGGTGTIFSFVGDLSADFAVNDTLYADISTPTFTGLLTIFSVTVGANTDVEVTIDTGADGASVVNILNNISGRANFRVRFDITDDDTSADLLINIFFAPKQNGELIVDLQEAFVFSNDLQKTRQLKITVEEVWTGATGTIINLTVIQSILAFLQIQSVRGSNLVDHLLALQAVSLEGVQDETGTASLLAAGVAVGDGGPPSNLLNVASLIP